MLALDTENLHPSTMLCLEALQALHRRHAFDRILDMGCGNGMLSVMAAKIWPEARVLAADVSPKAVEDANRAFAEHRLQDRITALRSDGFSQPLIHELAPYGLICCNLLAGVLLDMAGDIKKCLKPDGYAILSGVLTWKAPEVEKAYMGMGFEIVEKSAISPWCGYTVCHKNDI